MGAVKLGQPLRERRRASASACLRAPGLLLRIIHASQATPLGPLATPQTLGPVQGTDRFAAGRAELADGPRLFQQFRGRLEPSAFAGLRILDLGCGYGGRSVYYATECRAAYVAGVEPFAELVVRCRELARDIGCADVRFEVGRAEELPFEDASFDAVVSFDVLEHVQDPERAFQEIRRVLRGSGRAWLVFPTYRGARASHLDFITRVPALHRIFDPDTIVSAVNHELHQSDGNYGVRSLASPTVSPLGYLTLPNLNGMTRRDALRLMSSAGLTVRREVITPFLRTTDPIPGARILSAALDLWQSLRTLPELLIGSLAYEVSRA